MNEELRIKEMTRFDQTKLKQLFVPQSDSHKGQNGKLMIIGGSQLFHSASIWALQSASRMVDMVFYSSVKENNQIVHELKKEFRNGIIVPRQECESYIAEADAILIGPGMVRTEKKISKKYLPRSIADIELLADEGEQTYFLTKYLLHKYPEKKWIIDAGALQMMDPDWLLALQGNVVITPHARELERVFLKRITNYESGIKEDVVKEIAKRFHCIVLLKGEKDIVCSAESCVEISGGNAGMTKGGTGDVLAGLLAGLACKNDLFLATCVASFVNKKAGESLANRVGFSFNASDLADEIPQVLHQYLTSASE